MTDGSTYDMKFNIESREKTAMFPIAAKVFENRVIDTFYEEHIEDSNFYAINHEGELAGYFSVHKGNMLTTFHVYDKYARYAQDLFARAKKFEQVTCAFVATCDEQYLSLCMDNYKNVNKQAYFFEYRNPAPANLPKIELILADAHKDAETLALCGDFLSEEAEVLRTKPETSAYTLYIAKDGDELVGFGVYEQRKLLMIPSAGMYVMPEKRQKGYATAILCGVRKIAEEKGYKTVRSGCWYYNHNSKKSIEASGGVTTTRLLKFEF